MEMRDNHANASKICTLHGVRVHYRDVGVGMPVLLLHGWGSSAGSFALLQNDLSEQFRVLAVDLPGFGGSDMPPFAWQLSDYVNLVEAFLNELHITQPALLGHSFGGRIGICLAAKGLVAKLLLVNSAGVRPKRKPLYYIKINAYKTAKYFLKFAPQTWQPILLGKLQQRFGSSDYRNAAPLLRQVLVNVVNEDLTPYLPAITAPTLLMWGENDTTTPLTQARIMEKAIPDAGLVVLKNAGHFCYSDKPSEFNSITRYFLQH